jgi:hypothetical protein
MQQQRGVGVGVLAEVLDRVGQNRFFTNGIECTAIGSLGAPVESVLRIGFCRRASI